MYLHTDLACIHDGRHICCNHCSHSGLFRSLECEFHILDILIVHCDVEGEICLDSVLRTDAHDLLEISHLEVVGRVRAHVELLHSEIY